MRFLVTGAAGFIGFFVCKRLLEAGFVVCGVDDLNEYYSVALKRSRLEQLRGMAGFEFVRLDIASRDDVAALFARGRFGRVIHLAAQAGVRYSLDNPQVYADANLVGMLNVLEGCRASGVEHLVFASSSSVYGMNRKLPFSLEDGVDHPVSLYAATKRANELMAHSYAHLYQLPVTGLRFFTVYGPWGRPDMALFKFTAAMLKGEPVELYNGGDMRRDFTYIDDVVEAVFRVQGRAPLARPGWTVEQGSRAQSQAPYQLYNVGNGAPVALMEYVGALERALGRVADKVFLPMQAGDVLETYADTRELERDFGFRPRTPVDEGVRRFVSWYREFYGV